MKVWFSCKVKYGRETDEGSLKQVTDAYLFDAVSYTDAETRVHDVVGRELPGEFAVTQISKTNIVEVVNYEDSETWYKCKVSYSAVDADQGGKEKKINTYLLVSADNVREAYDRTEKHFDSMLVPYEIPSITLTTFVEVFPYNGDDIPSNLKPVDDMAGFSSNFPNFQTEGDDEIDPSTGEVISEAQDDSDDEGDTLMADDDNDEEITLDPDTDEDELEGDDEEDLEDEDEDDEDEEDDLADEVTDLEDDEEDEDEDEDEEEIDEDDSEEEDDETSEEEDDSEEEDEDEKSK